MTKRKTQVSLETERQLDTIANISTREEKAAWNRKLEKMNKLLEKLQPIEDKIIELNIEKIPIFDEVSQLRVLMVNSCIHPEDQLIVTDEYVDCKFCNKRITLVKHNV